MHNKTFVAVAVGLGLVALPALTGCGSTDTKSGADSKTVTLVSHHSWSI